MNLHRSYNVTMLTLGHRLLVLQQHQHHSDLLPFHVTVFHPADINEFGVPHRDLIGERATSRVSAVTKLTNRFGLDDQFAWNPYSGNG